MKAIRLRRLLSGVLALVVLAGALPLGAIPATRLGIESPAARVLAQGGMSIHLPLVARNYLDPAYRLSRFGISHVNLLNSPPADVNAARIGHHLSFTTQVSPPRPGGIEYLQVIRLTQVGDEGYTSSPSGSGLLAAVTANPGALWLIGNEPDRIREDEAPQDDIEPHVYARAYAELYQQIKGQDPSALVAAGSIVQPTKVRMRYLDMVLEAYRAQNAGATMPVDVWSTHVYILPECPDFGWGAKMPPGVTDSEGCTTYTPWDNADVSIFKEMVQRFREWMATNGYQDTPLYITEFGVLMPWDMLVFWDLKPEHEAEARAEADAKVFAFMDESTRYLLTKTNPSYGYPADGNRLVQRWAWYSHEDLGSFNGHLFDPITKQRTPFGDQYAAIAAAQPATVNLYAWRLWVEPGSPLILPLKDPIRVYATIANNGNVETRNAVAVRFYDGNPEGDGVQIGDTQYIAPLGGGAALATVGVSWTPAEEGTYQLHVRVDPLNTMSETDEGDNAGSITVEVMGS